MHSFYIFDELEYAARAHASATNYDLHILPISPTPHEFQAQQTHTKCNLWTIALDDTDLTSSSEISDIVSNATQEHMVSGFVLDVTSLGNTGVNKNIELLTQLRSRGAPVIIKCHHDDMLLHQLDLGAVAGIIIANACILSSGHRRDYFRSQGLRDIMTKCAEERQQRPHFFVGFYDLWDTRPSAAVVRRANKIADHFGAILEHGPKIHAMRETTNLKPLPNSMSGFEYLRRSETSELQKSWINRKRVVQVVSDHMDESKEVASLPFGGIQKVLPDIDMLMLPLPLPHTLESIDRNYPPEITVPNYTQLAPKRTDFWDFSADGEQVSFYGCIPFINGASPAQYDAVLETQTHLRSLKMLQQLDEADINMHIESLCKFSPLSKYQHLIDALIDGLTKQVVNVYKGLGSGFTVPDSSAEFWGLSVTPSESPAEEVDIFISRRSPSDIHVILHTWLAHHGVPRVHRFDEELRLERMLESPMERNLPLCIRHDIETGTPAEILFVLQQIQICQVDNPFKSAIEAFCKATLICDTSSISWNDAHSRRYLDGSVTLAALLERRLKEFTELGATQLPSLDNLIQLARLVEEIVHDCLYHADREPLNIMTDALLHAYDPWNSWTNCSNVDVNADLFALIFFCILRKTALEDVYIEATDRCPFFLSQPDQAAVFSELWVLGSQCELYFGILPRDLGEIVFNQYRDFLKAHPPPPGDWSGKIMTVYTKPEATILDRDMDPDGPARDGFNVHKTSQHLRKLFLEFGALSIFCLPAILDVLLLTFVGRGLFMTAWMGREHLPAACYALLISLLVSSGVTGWVGSVGNYYLYNVSRLTSSHSCFC